MRYRIISILFMLFLSFTAFSRPAKTGRITFVQPDGTTFYGRIMGDEFMKLTTTSNGNAIIQDNEGWWCYAFIDENGKRTNSGCRIGDSIPQEIEIRSRNIPYAALTMAAARRRSAVAPCKPFSLKEMLSTRSEEVPVKHGLVILAQFKDVSFEYGREDFIALLTREGYSANNAKGSAKEYFDDQFGGTVDFRFDISEPVTLSGVRASYGGNTASGDDIAPAEMAIEACRLADEQIDFSLYDDDEDGFVDNVFIFFAGGDEAEGAGEECIWSHAWYIQSGAQYTLQLDGKFIDRYACTSELSRLYATADNYTDVFTSIGSFCHEYAHTFGLPDFYDTDYEGSGGNAAGMWIWTSLMDGGNQNDRGNTPPYFNAVEREILGLSEPVTISRDGTYELEPLHMKGMTYRIDTDHEKEYYLLEYRSGEGWDSHIGGSGMLVYHIDKSNRTSGMSELYGEPISAEYRWLYTNEVNCRPDHQCADLIEADNRQDAFSGLDDEAFRSLYSNISGIFYPNAGADRITSDKLTFWSGNQGNVEISNIKRLNNKISFSISGISGSEPPKPVGIRCESFMNTAIIQFECNRLPFDGEAVIEWGRPGKDTESVKVKAYESGKYAVVIDDLESGNKTYSVNISFEDDGIRGEIVTVSFMTKRQPAVQWPYIYLSSVSRNDDGTFAKGAKLPLVIYNAAEAAEISWEYNGKPINRQGDGYYSVMESGILKAHVIWDDGAEDTIIKEIIVTEENK